MEYKKLFDRCSIGKVELKNRIVMSAVGTSLAAFTGEAGDELIAYYRERAKGGAGLIITELTRIDEETGAGLPNQLSLTSVKHIPDLHRLVECVHTYDTKIFLKVVGSKWKS